MKIGIRGEMAVTRCTMASLPLSTTLVFVLSFFFCGLMMIPLTVASGRTVPLDPVCNRRPGETAELAFNRHRTFPDVDPFIGTGGDGYGAVALFPGAQVPFGMARLSPDSTGDHTDLPFRHLGGYSYCDDEIQAFSHLHMVGAGVSDLGNLGIIPFFSVNGSLSDRLVCRARDLGGYYVRLCDYKQRFSHWDELAEPGRYSVVLQDSREKSSIIANLSATAHAAIHRYQYLDSNLNKHVVIDPCHNIAFEETACLDSAVWVDAVTPRRLQGWIHFSGGFSGRSGGFNLSFVIDVSDNFDTTQGGTWAGNGNVQYGQTYFQGTDGGIVLTFSTLKTSAVELKVGISFLDLATAKQNLIEEIGSKDFSQVAAEASATWAKYLNSVRVEGGEQEDRTKFYTSLYHAFMAPTNFTESTGNYLGFNQLSNPSQGYNYYTDLSIWDIYRTEWPLLVLLTPDIATDVVNSMLTMANEGEAHKLPKWAFLNGDTGSMEGLHTVAMIADFIFNAPPRFVNQVNITDALQKSSDSLRQEEGSVWLDKGFIPNKASESLCFAFDDFCVAQIASAVGDKATENDFRATSDNWKNLWNSRVKFLCNRLEDGSWSDCSSFLWPDKAADPRDHAYTEGDAWHYRWYVPHAIEDLIALFGGPEEFTQALDYFFTSSTKIHSNLLPNPFYWAGNEPDIQTPFLFLHANRSDLNTQWVRYVQQEKYTLYSDGIGGNDDYGTMSAWNVLASIGIYPEHCVGTYALSLPLFDEIDITFSSAVLHITTHRLNTTCNTISKIAFQGNVLSDFFIDSQALIQGGLLEYWCTE